MRKVTRTLYLAAALAFAYPSQAEIVILSAEPFPGAGGLVTVYTRGLTGITGYTIPSEIPRPTTVAGIRVAFTNCCPQRPVADAPIFVVGAEKNEWNEYQVVVFQAPAPSEWITVYGYNFGPVTPQPRDGFPAGLDPLSRLQLDFTDAGGPAKYGIQARLQSRTGAVLALEVDFFGLAPGNFGYYQINMRMPAIELPAGPAMLVLERAAVRMTGCNPAPKFCVPEPYLATDSSNVRLY